MQTSIHSRPLARSSAATPDRVHAKVARRVDSGPVDGASPGAADRAPTAPPLTDAPSPSGGEGDERESGATSVEVDPLVGNGLSSPLCDDAPGGSGLTGASRRNCETSGFVAAEAPTGDYGIDVHIDTGVLGLSSGGLLSAVQELFVTPLWMALVWAVHALVVMLEWCFTIDLLDSASVSSGIGATLRRVQATFTVPWLAMVLAIGSMLAVYNGLIRRRVAETLGQALLAFAMMAAGIWVTLDPVGTVGALGDWANQASLGTLAVTATGVPSRAGATLANGVGSLFAATVEVPWCYLEFGDVAWCRDPARLDPRLRAAALSIADGEMALARCKPNARALHLCAPPGSAGTQALERSVRLLRAARTNGAVFLALPANGSGAQLDQRSRIVAVGDLPERRSDELSRPELGRGRVPHQPRYLGEGRRAASDRRRRIGHAADDRLHCPATAGGGAVRALVSDARTGGGARAGARRGRPRDLSQVGRAAARSCRLQARVLVPARRSPGRAGSPGKPRNAGLVDPVAADVGLLVGSVCPAPPGDAAGRWRARIPRGRRATVAGRPRERSARESAPRDRRRPGCEGALRKSIRGGSPSSRERHATDTAHQAATRSPRTRGSCRGVRRGRWPGEAHVGGRPRSRAGGSEGITRQRAAGVVDPCADRAHRRAARSRARVRGQASCGAAGGQR